MQVGATRRVARPLGRESIGVATSISSIVNSHLGGYLLRRDETGALLYACRGDSASRPSALGASQLEWHIHLINSEQLRRDETGAPSYACRGSDVMRRERRRMHVGATRRVARPRWARANWSGTSISSIVNSYLGGYLLRRDETGAPSYACRGSDVMRREPCCMHVGATRRVARPRWARANWSGTSISSIVNSYLGGYLLRRDETGARRMHVGATRRVARPRWARVNWSGTSISSIVNSYLGGYLLRRDETGALLYACRGDSASRPSALGASQLEWHILPWWIRAYASGRSMVDWYITSLPRM